MPKETILIVDEEGIIQFEPLRHIYEGLSIQHGGILPQYLFFLKGS